MLDIYTYLFYTLFLIFCLIYSNQLKVKNGGINKRSEIDFSSKRIYLLMLIYSLVIGLRYKVGWDFVGYEKWLNELRRTGIFPVDNDIGFIWLNKLIVFFHFENYALFILMSFFQIFFILKFLEKIPFLRVWFFFFFFTSLLFFVSLNAMRQALDIFIFMYCLQLFFDKKYFFFLCFFTLSLSIHKTVMLVFIFVPFLKWEWYENYKLQIFFLVLSTFVLGDYKLVLLKYASPFANFLGYNYYIENIDFINKITIETRRGDGSSIYLFFFIDLFIILFYDKLKNKFINYNFISFYNLFFTGVILSRVFVDNFILARIADYFIFFRVVILSFLMFYIFNIFSYRRRKFFQPIAISICVAMLLFYYKAIYNNAAGVSPFQFVFDHD